MKKLIVNADDLGLTEGITRGIAECLDMGVVTRTSAMMCAGGAQWIRQYGMCDKQVVGLHLQLTDGKPILAPEEVPSLVVNAEGDFPSNWRYLNKIDPQEVGREWDAQLQVIRELGITPTHLDTHHNVHRFPDLFEEYCNIAKKYKLAVRPLNRNMAMRLRKLGLTVSDICLEEWNGMNVSVDSFIAHILGAFRSIGNDGVVEVMCHPGYTDESLALKSHYLEQREMELKVLTDPEIASAIERQGIQLCS